MPVAGAAYIGASWDQCCAEGGPPSTTLAQLQNNISVFAGCEPEPAQQTQYVESMLV